MQTAGTDAASPPAEADAIRRANLDALRACQPKTAKLIEATTPPFTLESTAGRDGAPTIAWTDGSGRRKWLGDTTMPSVSEEALIEQFEAGSGNAILSGIGQGTAVRLLADRLRPHQAIFVVEPDAWRAAAALQLHAFADAIRHRRLLMFVSRDAWDHLVEHLVECPGYFVPDRTLAWPWLTRGDVHLLTEQITTMQTRVNEQRARPGDAVEHPFANRSPRVFIGSNASDPTAHRWARRLAQAVRGSDGAALCCVPDDPSMMHPAAIERQIDQLRPTVSLLIDCVPTQLAYLTGDAPAAVIVSHTHALGESLLQQLPPDARLFVRTSAQREAAKAAGVDAGRVTLILPGIIDAPRTAGTDVSLPPSLVVLADNRGVEREDLGLHLGSHQRLWRSARDWIADNADAYHDDLAADALTNAEQALDFHIQSPEVRAGLVERIRSTLGPQVVAEEILAAVVETGIPIELHGDGWQRHEKFARFARNKLPNDRASVGHVESPAAALLWLGTTDDPDDRVLDWLASGRPVFIRRNDAANETAIEEATWTSVIDCQQHVTAFSTRAELTQTIETYRSDPAPYVAKAAEAGDHLRTHHTWRHRLAALLASFE